MAWVVRCRNEGDKDMLEKNSVLVMIGDSITDCGRNYDAPPAGWGSFGDGYVNQVNAHLMAFEPQQEIMVINKGISGNTIRDLKERWQKDVLDLEPDYVSIMIGVNDVWRHFDSAAYTNFPQVSREEFGQIYEELIQKTLPQVRQVYLLSPFMIEPNRDEPMGKMVREYAGVAKILAEKYGLVYVDVQAKMDVFLKHKHSYALSSDRVHPALQGHVIIAKAFLDAIGMDWRK